MKTLGLRIATGILCLSFASCEQTVLSSQSQSQDRPKDSAVQVANPPSAVVDDGVKSLEVGGAPVESRLKFDSNEWFRFHVDSGKRYRIVLESNVPHALGGVEESNLLYPQFLLNSDSLTQLMDFYPDELEVHYCGLRTGPALLWLRAANSEDTVRYRVSVVLDTTGVDAYEPDDDPVHASQIGTEGGSQIRFLRTREHDWAWFPMEAGKSYRIETSGNLASFDLHQGGAFEDSILRSNWTLGSKTQDKIFTASRTGKALLDISGFGSYTLSVQTVSMDQDAYEPDDIPGRATSIQIGAELQTHVLRAGEIDYLKFQGDSGVVYTASVSFQGSGKSLNLSVLNTSDTLWHWSVPGPDGIRLPVAQNSTVTISGQDSVSFLAIRSGEFLVKVEGAETDARGPYTINVNRKP